MSARATRLHDLSWASRPMVTPFWLRFGCTPERRHIYVAHSARSACATIGRNPGSLVGVMDSNRVLHPDLHGRVAIVTGASRGIGKALAVRLAQEGADVAIASKSEESTEKLPGSIHETAEAIRALGRRAIAVPTDVRDENAIRNMVDRTAAELGRIDILVNNAGAIWTRPIVETP